MAVGLRVGRPLFAVSATPADFGGLVTALVALISLAVFLGVAGIDIRQFWIAALVSIAAMMLAGSAGRRFAFRVRMWGTSSPHVKCTGDFCNAIEGRASSSTSRTAKFWGLARPLPTLPTRGARALTVAASLPGFRSPTQTLAARYKVLVSIITILYFRTYHSILPLLQ